nr:putative F-box/kelch-repeat protein At3g17280 isoform X4 [Lolium perenne]
MTFCRRRRHPNSSPAAPLEDDDLLAEILLRLPPQPSSLPRASLTCKRWRRLIRDPGFLRRFRAHHRSRGTAPVLGFFTKEDSGISFHPTLDPPNRVPPERFRLHITGSPFNCRIVCCRDGLVLLVNVHPGQVLVWDPVTGDRRSLLLPPVFRNMDKFYSGMVLRSAAAAAGDGDRFQFQVVFVRCFKGRNARAVACVYSSDTGAWGDLIQTSTPLQVLRTHDVATSGSRVGRSLYWSLHGNSSNAILEFDLDRQNLAVIPLHMEGWIMSAQGGGLGLVSVLGHTAQLWKRETDPDGVSTWRLTKTVHLNKLLPLRSGDRLDIDFADESNMLILGTVDGIGIFTVHTESMQCKKLPVEFKKIPSVFQPFSSVYTPEMGVGAEHAGAEPLHNIR